MIAEMRSRREERMAALPDSVRQNAEARTARFQGDGAGGGEGQSQGGARGQGGGGFPGQGGGAPGEGGGFQGQGGFGGGNRTMLWYLDEDGRVSATPVRTGISDGQMTEIIGRDIEPGLQVITGVTATEESGISSPFQSQQSDPGARFRGF
jgi:hypothetical protein